MILVWAFRPRAYWQADPNQLSLGMMRTYWTPERDEELQRHAAAGLSAAKIAVLLHTTRGAILRRSNRLRVSLLGEMQTFWTPERDEELQRHAAAGLSAAEIAVLLQTTQSAIRGRSNRLRVSLGAPQTFWTPERDEELHRHAAAGLSAAEIAVLLYTTRGAVLGRSNRLRGKASRMRSAY
jgi:hypothetical protein